MIHYKHLWKPINIAFILFSIFVTPQPLLANETGPDGCGETITLIGNTNHSSYSASYTVENATNNNFYKEEIWGGDFTAAINNLSTGDYTLKVYMAESYHSAAAKRSFNVYVEGVMIIEELDIFKEVGKDSEYLLSHTFSFAPNSEDTELSIRFEKVIDNAKFNAIEIINANNEVVACGAAHEFAAEIEPLETGNPFIQHMFTADPSAHVFEDKIYVYPSHDENNPNGFNMRDYHVFSSNDLSTWEDHGLVLDVDSVAWASEYMWAPDCAYKDGTYYFYFPAKDLEGEFRIGVATSDKPYGPFIPEDEPIKGSFSVDPGVFIDDDGEVYMYFGGDGDGGQKTPWVAKMDDSMKEFSEDPIALTGIDYWFEACWLNKIDDTYYLSYSTGTYHPDYPDRSAIAYATSNNPMGPFEYQGVVNAYVSGWTNHHSIVDYQGQSYLFYHNSDLSGGNTVKRSICADYIHFADGKLSECIQTKQGIGKYDGLKNIEAENYFISNGTSKAQCSEGAYQVIFENDQSISFNQINFEEKTMKYLALRVTSEIDGGKFQISDDKGSILGELDVDKTGGLDQWATMICPITDISGINNIVIKYIGNDNAKAALNWISFEENNTTSTGENKANQDFNIFPNPVTNNELTIQLNNEASSAQINIYTLTGAKVYSKDFQFASVEYHINDFDLGNGIYVMEVNNTNQKYSMKFEINK